jgi:hypothetical protein
LPLGSYVALRAETGVTGKHAYQCSIYMLHSSHAYANSWLGSTVKYPESKTPCRAVLINPLELALVKDT